MLYCILGTDEEPIIEILSSHTNEQRQAIKDQFKQAYGQVGNESVVDEIVKLA